jgi:hypothetical protein
MAIVLLIALIFVAALALHGYKRIQQMKEQRIRDNEYNAAVALWSFARGLKGQLDETLRLGTGVFDFSRVIVPHAQGYKISLELAGYNFHIFGIPGQHNKTGRLSFYVDNSLTLRAGDHGGQPATDADPEYTGGSKV